MSANNLYTKEMNIKTQLQSGEAGSETNESPRLMLEILLTT